MQRGSDGSSRSKSTRLFLFAFRLRLNSFNPRGDDRRHRSPPPAVAVARA